MCRKTLMLYISCFCTFCKFICEIKATESNCDIDIDGIVSKEFALENHQFWSAKTADVTDCAKNCVKRKLCQSFNFDTGTLQCELNNDTYGTSKLTRTGLKLLYSNINNWPAQLDPDCFDRPCANDEVCVPGFLAGNSQSQCSYSCFKSAASTGTNPVLSTSQPPLTPAPTTTTEPTTATAAQTTIAAPSTTTTAPTTIAAPATTAEAPTSTSAAPTTTDAPITTAAPTTTTAAPTTTTAAPTTTTAPPTTTTAPPTTTTAPPTTTSTTAAAPTNIQLVDGNTGNEGRLEIKYQSDPDHWRTVQLETGKWTWKATQVVCRHLGFPFGGSYHEANKPFPKGSYKSFKLEDIACTGNEATLFDCPISNFKKENTNDKDIGITCFTYNVFLTGYNNLHIVFGGSGETRSGHVEILYSGQWTRVCGDLKNKAPDVFCATVSNGALVKDGSGEYSTPNTAMWTKDIECFEETVPHPFFCLNEGWRLQDCNRYAYLSCKDP